MTLSTSKLSFLFTVLILFFSTLSAFASDYYWVGGAGDYSDLSHWATSSGGSTFHVTSPTPTDNIYFDENSFSADNQDVNFNQLVQVNDFIAVGVSHLVSFSSSLDFEIHGSFKVQNNISLAFSNPSISLYGDDLGNELEIQQGSFNLDENGSVYFGGDGAYTLLSNLSLGTFRLGSGTVITGANTIKTSYFETKFSNAKTIDLSNTTVITDYWDVQDNSILTFTGTGSSISVTETFDGQGFSYGELILLEPGTFSDGTVISGSNIIDVLIIEAGATFLGESGVTNTVVSSITLNGTVDDFASIASQSESNTTTISGTGITINGDFVVLQDAHYSGTANFNITNTVLGSNVIGWEVSVIAPNSTGNFYFSKVYAESTTIQIEPGDGAERIVFMRQGNSFPDVTVVENTAYVANQTYGSGSMIGTDTYVVYQGNDDSFIVEGLMPATLYSISVLELNKNHDASEIKYSNTTTSFSKTAETLLQTDIVMGNATVVNVSSDLTFYDDGGNGTYYPDRTSTITFNSGTIGEQVELSISALDISSTESLKIYNNTDTLSSALLLAELSGDSHSFPLVFESTEGSLTVSFKSNDFSESTFNNTGWEAMLSSFLAKPSILSSEFSTSREADTEIDFDFIKGNGTGRLIVGKSGSSSIQFVPSSDEVFTADAELGVGQDLGNGEYVIGFGDLDAMTISGLTEDSYYTIKIYEYNQVGAEYEYADAGYTFVINNILDSPTITSSEGKVVETSSGNITFDFVPGDGDGRIIIAKEGEQSFSFHPISNIMYSADPAFGSGQDLGNDEFVVANGDIDELVMSDLIGQVYSIRIIEYNQQGDEIKYSFFSYDFTVHNTIPPPTVVSSNAVVNDTGVLSIDFSFTPGDGDGRMVIVKQGLDPIVFVPAYNTEYNVGSWLSTGEYCRGYGDINGVNLQFLEEGETYTIKVIEYSRDGDDIVYMQEGYEFTLTLDVEAPLDMMGSYGISMRVDKLERELIKYDISIEDYGDYDPFQYFNNWVYVMSEDQLDVSTLPFEDGYSVTASNIYGDGTEVLPGAYVVAKTERSTQDVTVEGLSPDTEYHLYTLMFKENELGVKYGVNGINHTITRTLEDNAYLFGESPNIIDSEVLLYSPSALVRTDCSIDETVTYYPTSSDQTLNLKVLTAQLNNFDFKVYDGESVESDILADYSDEYSIQNLPLLTATNEAGALTILYDYESSYSCSGASLTGFKSLLYNTPKTTVVEAPSLPASDLELSNINTTSATLSWVRGNGDKSLVLISYNADLSVPLNGIDYVANSVIEESSYLEGYYVVYNGDGNSVNITGLVAGRTYDVWIYEYNGSDEETNYSEVYYDTFTTVSSRPTIRASNLTAEVLDYTTAALSWDNGNGNRRIVVQTRCQDIVDGLLDGQEFLANSNMESATEYQTDPFNSDCYAYRILYDGTEDHVTVTDIPRDLSYNFYVLEYMGDGLERNYLVSEEGELHGIPEKPSVNASADDLIVVEERAISVNLQLDMPNYSSTEKIVYVSTSDEQIPIEEGFFEGISEGLEFENGYTLPYLEDSDFDIGFLDPNTTYFITVYAAAAYGDAINIDLERGLQVEVRTGGFKDYYWVGGDGSWSDTDHWATSSGGTTKHIKIPDLESKVIFDVESSSADTLSVYISDLTTYSVYSISQNGLNAFLHLEDDADDNQWRTLGVNTSLILGDSISIDIENINLYGYESSNNIQVPDGVAPTLDRIGVYGNSRSGTINFEELPDKLGSIYITDSEVLFEESIDSLEVGWWKDISSEISSIPILTGISYLSSAAHFESITAANNTSRVTMYGNLIIDDLNLGVVSNLQLNSGDTLTVGNITRDTTIAMDIVASITREESYVECTSDTLLVNNVTISDNYALGEAVYLAQNSNLFTNVEGWVLEGEKELSISGHTSTYLTYGDSTTVEVSWYLPSKGKVLIVLNEGDENKGFPEDDSIYNSLSDLAQEELLFIDGGENDNQVITGLKPNTQYTIRSFIYVANEAGDKVAYSRDSESVTFKTATIDALYMKKNGTLTIVADNSILYTHAGVGYDESDSYSNEVIIIPKSENTFASFTFLKVGHCVDVLAVYEEGNSSALYSAYLSDEYDNENHTVITASQPGENLRIVYYDRGFSTNSGSSIFYTTSVNNNPASQPLEQVTNFQSETVSASSVALTWQNAGKTIIIGQLKPSYGSDKTSPIDNVTYSASLSFGKGDELTYGSYVLYTGDENEVTITGLSSFSEYRFFAFSYNDGDDTDINYNVIGSPEVTALTFASKPEGVIEDFVINDISIDAIELSYLNRESDMSIILLKESSEITVRPQDGVDYNTSTSFGSGDALADDTYFMYKTTNEVSNVRFRNLKEGTTYYYEVLTVNGEDTLSIYASEGYSGQFTTDDASYEISYLSDTLLCAGSILSMDYDYLGSGDYGDNVVLLASNLQMTDSLVLSILDSGYHYYNVALPVDLANGDYYVAVVPFEGNNNDVYTDKITLVEGYEPTIERIAYDLVASNSRRVSWYLDDLLIDVEENETLTITSSGTYRAVNHFGDCEYSSEDFIVKPEIYLNELDTIGTWLGAYLPIDYSSFGDISIEGLSVLLASDLDSLYDETLVVDSIDANYIYVNLPSELNGVYYYIKTQSESMLSFGVSTCLISAPEVRLELEEDITACAGYQTEIDLSIYGIIDSLDDIELSFSLSEDGEYEIESVVDSVLISGLLYMTVPEIYSGKYYFKLNSQSLEVSGIGVLEVQKFDTPTIEVLQEGNTLVSNYESGNQWYQEGSLLEGEIGQYLNFNSNGIYQVAVDKEACTLYSEEFELLILGVSESEDQESVVQIWPNPFNEKLMIRYPIENSLESVILEIYDMSARSQIRLEVTARQLNSGIDLPIGDLDSGSYLLLLTYNDKKIMKRVIKNY